LVYSLCFTSRINHSEEESEEVVLLELAELSESDDEALLLSLLDSVDFDDLFVVPDGER
jgi:hypothetical protein